MMQWRLPRVHPPLWRLALIVGLFAAGLAMMEAGARPGLRPSAEWFDGKRQALISADLSYRLGDVLELIGRRSSLDTDGLSHDFRERAVAAYERLALGSPHSAGALHRLGLIYGARGYSTQARDMLGRGAAQAGEQAAALLAVARVYDPDPPPSSQGDGPPPALLEHDGWLGDMALIAWADRFGTAAQVRQYRAQADLRTLRFGLVLAALTLTYGLIGLVGLVTMTLGVVRWAFFLPPENRRQPSMSLPWGPLDAVETAGVAFFAAAALALVAGVLQGLPLLQSAPPVGRVALAILQYLLLAAAVLALIWARLPSGRRGLALLGLRGRRLAPLIASGMVGYGLVLCLLILANLVGLNALPTASAADPLLAVTQDARAVVLLYLFVCAIVPLVEEIIFRGFVYAGLRQGYPVISATLGSALLFAVMHYSVTALVPMGIIGAVLANLYERTHSLLPPFICHALHNLLVLTVIVATR